MENIGFIITIVVDNGIGISIGVGIGISLVGITIPTISLLSFKRDQSCLDVSMALEFGTYVFIANLTSLVGTIILSTNTDLA